jgi:Predicted hydrolase (metallo-beta-lactamase superfamily)
VGPGWPRLDGLAPDVVKVSHHGSADQSPALYRDLGAQVAIIGVGADNDYGHPTPRALDILRTTGAIVLRSDERGTLTLHREGDEIRLWSERGQ